MKQQTGKHKAGVAASLVLSLGFAGSLVCVSNAVAEPQQVQAVVRADADIQTDVAYGLLHAPQLQGQHITAATIQGEVTLSGTVQSDAAKQAAQQIARGVSGVQSVQNNLTVNAAAAQQSPAAPDQDEQTPPPPPYDQGTSNPDYEDQAPSNANQGGYQGNNYPQNYPASQQPDYQQPSVYQQPSSGPVTIPSGTLLNIRTSESLDTRKVQVGTFFQATVANDVFQGNVLAIPRGAVLTGQVTGIKKPGDLAGKSGLQLQITALNLGGQSYALTTDAWTSNGPGKGGYSTANTAGGAALGAVIGAIAGGGAGAAIGAVAGGATGLAASAATKGPQIMIPAEATLSFHLAGPVTVNPVSSQEIQRLAASAPQQPRLVRRQVYAPYYYGYPYYPYPYYRAYYYYPRY